MEKVSIGIIGGSGLYQIENLKIIKEEKITTPFGDPSDSYLIGELEGKKIAFLARHGRNHSILPSELNHQANIYGFKKLGVTSLIAVSAVGSLQEEILPTHLVFPNQIIDRTKGRKSTFFGEGIVGHIAFAEPFCKNMIELFSSCAKELGITFHKNKTYVCMEGPAFSTKAESHLHRQIGGDLIGMTAIPEAKLAREAEICYGTIALSTDYDCWHESEEAVTVEMVIGNIKKNVSATHKLLGKIIPKINEQDCSCHHALEGAIMTGKEHWPDKTKKKLEVIIKRFL
ncbi:MAG: S-methyl-5'-thioadenosine phosphorylase [Spirochaetes bacterium]|nr:S-methyl-5'-thioadenosine phosphorylase [Spirochaetota bacterium]